jgi:hypothetical protein
MVRSLDGRKHWAAVIMLTWRKEEKENNFFLLGKERLWKMERRKEK